jgi:mannose-6-phosphate isomerase-like protein (cupin superfamily)
MLIRTSRYMIADSHLNSGVNYWSQDFYPEWVAISTLLYFPGQKAGGGVEPHYHDSDEFWLFLSGRGQVWLDNECFEITPNTLVYTPMGVVHRFQMFTAFENVPVVTRLERQRRATHIYVWESGPPVRTVPGFVVPGSRNTGPFPDRGPRCPLSELRAVAFAAGEELAEARLSQNEHWVVVEGAVSLRVEGREVELSPGDLALLRAGAVRGIRARQGARLAVARE